MSLNLVFGLLFVAQPAPPSAPPVVEGFFTAHEGVRLFFRKVGRGRDTVVFLHGGPGSNFRGSGDALEALAGPLRTVTLYDQRGSGRSDIVSDRSRLTAAHHVRDLEALRRHFGLARISLAGLSWGAGLAALYASEHPARVDRLLLISPLPPAKVPYWEQRLARMRSLRGAVEMALEGQDSLVPLDAAREWAATLPNARLLLVPDAGHEFFVDQPAAFQEAAAAFLPAGSP